MNHKQTYVPSIQAKFWLEKWDDNELFSLPGLSLQGLMSTHLLVVDIGQDSCNDLQEKDAQQQYEVL